MRGRFTSARLFQSSSGGPPHLPDVGCALSSGWLRTRRLRTLTRRNETENSAGSVRKISLIVIIIIICYYRQKTLNEINNKYSKNEARLRGRVGAVDFVIRVNRLQCAGAPETVVARNGW